MRDSGSEPIEASSSQVTANVVVKAPRKWPGGSHCLRQVTSHLHLANGRPNRHSLRVGLPLALLALRDRRPIAPLKAEEALDTMEIPIPPPATRQRLFAVVQQAKHLGR